MASSTTLLGYIGALSTDTEFTDAVLVAKTEDGASMDLPSHLNILARSPVFKRMLSGAFAEGTLKRVEIPVTHSKHLWYLREFLYNDDASFPDDWTPSDFVDVMALGDKYDVTRAFNVARKELMEELDCLDLDDALQIVEQLHTSVGPAHENLVREALAIVLSAVDFGRDVMKFLIWLQRFHCRTGLPCEAEKMECMKKVSADKVALEQELAIDHGSTDGVDLRGTRMLMIATFLERVSNSLATECVGYGSKSCPHGIVVKIETKTEINKDAKPQLRFGIERLMQDMNAMFMCQAQPEGRNPDSPSAKRQKVS